MCRTVHQLLAQNATAATNDGVAIDDFGNITETVAVTTSGYQGVGDTETIVTSANRLSSTSTVTLAGQSAALIQETKVTALDGTKTDTITYFNSSTPSFIERQDIVSTSFDGRTISESPTATMTVPSTTPSPIRSSRMPTIRPPKPGQAPDRSVRSHSPRRSPRPPTPMPARR
ncbi:MULTISPECIES: hypothetical protein [unclassified Bradyrhizobium]|uniref:hypothetical protein n=1 Tax=unclassified Bradyrhizobium TaxID=2631580 RepID=UPI00244A95FA|nr:MULTISPECIES: hypothetical protein [unclassified Bradyrhizobium]MDH2346132.1 hypothetical protein [Bradyrhizobium sp. SSUT77]MDH2350494.1 hypothetical protein [Bradyrhizobium sp. SSUT112]